MFSRLPRLAVVAALACSVGLHWAVFQSIAWVGMIVTYSQDAPLKEAIAKTFDGNHPCSLCKEIGKEKQSEKKSQAIPLGKKLEFLCGSAALIITAPPHCREVDWPDTTLRSLTRMPPVPPPRQLPG